MSHDIAGRIVPFSRCLYVPVFVRNSAPADKAAFQNWLNQFQTSWYCQLPLDMPGSRGSGVWSPSKEQNCTGYPVMQPATFVQTWALPFVTFVGVAQVQPSAVAKFRANVTPPS